jgi:hypothetical protein
MSISVNKAASPMALVGSKAAPISYEEEGMFKKVSKYTKIKSPNFSIAKLIVQYDGRFMPLKVRETILGAGSVVQLPPSISLDPHSALETESSLGLFDGAMFRFHIQASEVNGIETQLRTATICNLPIGGRMVTVIDGLLSEAQSSFMRTFFAAQSFPFSNLTGDDLSEHEKMRCLSISENLALFTCPLPALVSCYQLIAYLAEQSDAVASTQPWLNNNRPAFTENRVVPRPKDVGFHIDWNPENGLGYAFARISESVFGELSYYPDRFTNGEEGNPFLASIVGYSTPKEFSSETHGMGTILVDPVTGKKRTIPCKDSRFLFFEGSIKHGFEKAKIKKETPENHRTSFNMVICFRHKKAGDMSSLKLKVMSAFERLRQEGLAHRRQAALATK